MKRVVMGSALCAVLVAATAVRADYPPLWDGTAAATTDLVLIYQGGSHRKPWTPERLQPYVSYRDPSGHEQWLFDGFLFLEILDGQRVQFTDCCKKPPASRADWTMLLDRLFARGQSLYALEHVVATMSQRIGAPARPRRVYLGLPEPILHDKSWGALDDGRPLDFDRAADRVAAVRWYIVELMQRWRALAPRHLQLAGFYWVAENAQDARDVVPEVANVAHEARGALLWIPYWTSPMRTDWRALGFDRAYYQPNFFFHPEIPVARIGEACRQARAGGAGLEVELDDRVFIDDRFRPRIDAYLDGYETEGAAATAPLAWYEGGGTLAKLATSNLPQNRAIYDRVARFVVERQAAVDARRRR